MISSDTPYKLAEIIRDTWPNLYRPSYDHMNHRKHKQAENLKKKRMYTPEGYISDPPDAQCPYCGEKQKACSHVNSLSRAWARGACAKKHDNQKEHT